MAQHRSDLLVRHPIVIINIIMETWGITLLPSYISDNPPLQPTYIGNVLCVHMICVDLTLTLLRFSPKKALMGLHNGLQLPEEDN